MAPEGDVPKLREARLQASGRAVPDEHQGVSKDKIRKVLAHIDLHGNNDLVDAVFALNIDNVFDQDPPLFRSKIGRAHV